MTQLKHVMTLAPQDTLAAQLVEAVLQAPGASQARQQRARPDSDGDSDTGQTG